MDQPLEKIISNFLVCDSPWQKKGVLICGKQQLIGKPVPRAGYGDHVFGV